MIGDSQWIGGAAENGQYVKLNDFFDARKASRWRTSCLRP
jgi:multiple sugar transport system substrate-binding protein